MMHQVEEARSLDDIFETISAAVNSGYPASAGTYSDKDRYDGIRLYANHNYAVLGAGYDENTEEPYLLLRNPWGQLSLIITDVRTVRMTVAFKITEDFEVLLDVQCGYRRHRGRRGR